MDYIKRQKSVIFVNKDLKISTWKKKKYRNVRDHSHYTRKYTGVAHSICNLK